MEHEYQTNWNGDDGDDGDDDEKKKINEWISVFWEFIVEKLWY